MQRFNVDNYDDRAFVYSVDVDTPSIYRVGGLDAIDREDEAIRRLIEAAPVLLEALRAITAELEELGWEECAEIRDAHAAIAQATGEDATDAR